MCYIEWGKFSQLKNKLFTQKKLLIDLLYCIVSDVSVCCTKFYLVVQLLVSHYILYIYLLPLMSGKLVNVHINYS